MLQITTPTDVMRVRMQATQQTTSPHIFRCFVHIFKTEGNVFSLCSDLIQTDKQTDTKYTDRYGKYTVDRKLKGLNGRC